MEIIVVTVADFIAFQHVAYTHCEHCGYQRDIDLDRMARLGLSDRPVASLRLRCLRCSVAAGHTVLAKVMTPGRRHSGMDRPPPDNVVRLGENPKSS